MSFEAMADVVRYDGELTPTELLVLLFVADYTNQDSLSCFPSQKALAAKTRLSERTVRSTMASLEAKGLISRTARRSATTGAPLSDVITLLIEGSSKRRELPVGGQTQRQNLQGPAATAAAKPITEPTKESPPAPKGADVRVAIDLWNELAEAHDLPKAIDLTDARKKAIGARLKEAGLEGWRAALTAVAASRHCLGLNDRKWKANLDFVASPSGFAKLREGAYGRDAPRLRLVADAEFDPWPSRARSWIINRYWHDDDWGPRPGKPGCQCPPELLQAQA